MSPHTTDLTVTMVFGFSAEFAADSGVLVVSADKNMWRREGVHAAALGILVAFGLDGKSGSAGHAAMLAMWL